MIALELREVMGHKDGTGRVNGEDQEAVAVKRITFGPGGRRRVLFELSFNLLSPIVIYEDIMWVLLIEIGENGGAGRD